MQNTRGDFYILPHLFSFICARLFCSITRTYAHMHTHAYAHPVDFAYQRPVWSRNVAQPKTRSFELGFSQLYTRHTVPRCPPSLLVYVSCLISLFCSLHAQIRTIEPATRGRLQIAHITRTLAVTEVHNAYWNALSFHLKTIVEGTVIIVMKLCNISKVGEQWDVV